MSVPVERKKISDEYRSYCLQMPPEYYNYENAQIEFKWAKQHLRQLRALQDPGPRKVLRRV